MSTPLIATFKAWSLRYGILLFIITVFGLYLASPVIQSGDSRLVIYEANSLVTRSTRDLAAYGPIVDGWPCYRQGSEVISRYPYGTALFDIPFQSVAVSVSALAGHSAVAHLMTSQPRHFEKLLASAIAALAAAAIVLMALELTGRLGRSVVLGGIFAVGTSLWSTASRGLWQHGPMALLFALSIWALARARRRHSTAHVGLTGLLLGASYVVRPTGAVPLVITGVVLLVTWRRSLPWFIAAAAIPIIPSTIYNLITYHSISIPFYGGDIISGIQPHILTYLAGMMVSPARGLLVYSPFVVLGLAGLWMRRRDLNGLDVIAVVVILGNWALFADSTTWDAGGAYGPRFLTDILPFLAYLMIPVIDLIVRPVRRYSLVSGVAAGALVVMLGWAIFVNGRGATSWVTQLWNSEPTYVTPDSPRLWSWTHAPFFKSGHATYSSLYPSVPLPDVSASQLCIYPPS
jgi:hypothetical protein